jgi:hypothetical protein
MHVTTSKYATDYIRYYINQLITFYEECRDSNLKWSSPFLQTSIKIFFVGCGNAAHYFFQIWLTILIMAKMVHVVVGIANVYPASIVVWQNYRPTLGTL